NLKRLAVFFRKLKIVSKQKSNSAKIEVSLAIVGATRIRSLNNHYRGNDRITDVLSFSNESIGAESILGEIIICYPKAVTQAREQGTSLQVEIERLAIHGLMHLLGYDHVKDKEAEVMEAIENDLMKKITRAK
ncbi:rRNA maturation RNase YbeY, partial [bacterium]|nr:rRNA maturation RNase YbeY [bacterium]